MSDENKEISGVENLLTEEAFELSKTIMDYVCKKYPENNMFQLLGAVSLITRFIIETNFKQEDWLFFWNNYSDSVAKLLELDKTDKNDLLDQFASETIQ